MHQLILFIKIVNNLQKNTLKHKYLNLKKCFLYEIFAKILFQISISLSVNWIKNCYRQFYKTQFNIKIFVSNLKIFHFSFINCLFYVSFCTIFMNNNLKRTYFYTSSIILKSIYLIPLFNNMSKEVSSYFFCIAFLIIFCNFL